MSSDNYAGFFKSLEEDDLLIHDIRSLGWALWLPDKGYMDEHLLRVLADEIERRNKPFWDQYEEYCKALHDRNPDEQLVDEGTFDEFAAR